jgi:hypothetical protein
METLEGEEIDYWRYPFEECILFTAPFSLSLLPGCYEVASSFSVPHPSTMMSCLTSGPETVEPSDHVLNI